MIIIVPILLFLSLSAFKIDAVTAWSTKIPFFGANYRHQVSADGSGIAVGGQHLVRAGDSIQAAADSINVDDYYACTALLREAGVSLAEVGEAWVEDNWEAVTYAADDCSASFQALSQLQKRPILQKVYKGASGELMAVAGVSESSKASRNLLALGRFLKEAADETNVQEFPPESSTTNNVDKVAFRKSLREAAKSIERLAQETQYQQGSYL